LRSAAGSVNNYKVAVKIIKLHLNRSIAQLTLVYPPGHNSLMPNLLVHLFLPHESNNQRAKLLHPSALSLVIGLFVLFQLGIGKLAQTYPQILGYAAQIAPSEIVRLTNAQRQAAGVGPVQLDSELSQAAAQKAADMFAHDYWAHVSPQGVQPWTYITNSGYQYRYAGENLARDFTGPDAVVQAWMDSSSHKENLLNSRYQDIGVAVVDGQLEGRETTLVVQFFGTKLSTTAKPAIPKLAVSEVKAAESSPRPTQPPQTSPFDVTKLVSIALLAIFVVVLIIDLIAVHKQKIVRWTSKSLAHLALMLILLIAAVLINRGVIL